jgi:hypothetical protein
MEKKRTIGVTIVGWIMIVIQLPSIIGPIVILNALFSNIPLKGSVHHISPLELVISCCLFIAAIGILKLNNLARICAIWFSVYKGIVRYLFYWLTCIIYNRGSEAVPQILKTLNLLSFIDIGSYIFFIYFLTRPTVKEQFKQS